MDSSSSLDESRAVNLGSLDTKSLKRQSSSVKPAGDQVQKNNTMWELCQIIFICIKDEIEPLTLTVNLDNVG